MDPVVRFRIEKAAVDCGFEMKPVDRDDGLELRSARFPESMFVRRIDAVTYEVVASTSLLLAGDAIARTVTAEGIGALYEVLRTASAHARTLPTRVADDFKNVTATLPRGTEAERLVIQRVGQGLFRAALLDYWQGRCCVSGLDVPELLRASHIRPWALCESDEQRLDVFNGLLLAPSLDALFDSGLITVEDSGDIVVANVLTQEQRQKLGLAAGMRVRSLRSEHREYLSFHRDRVWRF